MLKSFLSKLLQWKRWSVGRVGPKKKAFAYFAAGCVSIYAVQKHFIGLILTNGDSMAPTIQDSAWLIVSKRKGSIVESVKIGDVLVFKDQRDPTQLICKRVAALEGDPIKYNGSSEDRFQNLIYVPRGHMWLLGDNRLTSVDSRDYGPIPVALTESKVLYQVYPKFHKIGAMK